MLHAPFADASPRSRALQGDLVATCHEDGGLCVWSSATGVLVKDFGKVAPSLKKSEWHAYNRVAWSPDGTRLACPGRNNDTVLFSQTTTPAADGADAEAAAPTWAEVARLKDGHMGDVSLVTFSPNGLYIATCGMDKAVLIWDLRQTPPAVVRRLKVTDDVTGCEWRSGADTNGLAVLLYDGQIAMWTSPVPRRMPPPAAALEDIDLSGYEAPPAGGYMDDSAVDAKTGEEGDDEEGGSDDDGDSSDGSDGDGQPKAGGHKPKERIIQVVQAPPPPSPIAQEAVQAGRTPFAGSPRRRFLAYNMLGSITCRDDGALQYIEVHFHDTEHRGPRMSGLTDYNSIALGALGPAGVALASAAGAAGRDTPAMLTVRPLDAWAGAGEWVLPFPKGESPVVLAAGGTFFAAATSTRLVRVFTPMGVQTAIFGLDGDVVAAAGHGALLALVWHAAPPEGPPPSQQRLRYMLLDTEQGSRVCEGPMPLAPAAQLTWLGFSDNGCLAATDSSGTTRLRSSAFGGTWVPVFDSNVARASDAERHWVVGLSGSEVYAVVVKAPDLAPTVASRPVLSIFPLALPVLRAPDAAGAETGALEDALLRAQLLAQEAAVASMAGDGSVDTTASLVALNKALLTLFNAAVKAQRHGRAAELVQRMSHSFALEGALRIANAARAIALAERITHIIAARGALQMQAAGEQAAVAEYAAAGAGMTAPSQQAGFASPPGGKFARKAAPPPPASRDENVVPASAPEPVASKKRDADGQAGTHSKRPTLGAAANPFARR